MWLSDVSVRRPVFATVINLLIIAFGILAFDRLPLRENPDIDAPIVSIETTYRGASASVIESRVTQIIEDRISGIEGVKAITSKSQDSRSDITVEFYISRDIDDAANDIRDRVSGILDNLPQEADPPEIRKADGDDNVIIWMNLASESMSVMELTDYAKRYVEDRFSSLDGVARVRIGGSKEQAMRVWIDRDKLAARNLTVADIEKALNNDNVELPAGTIESVNQDFTVRIERGFKTEEDFKNLVIGEGDNSYLVRLQDVARVEVGAVEERNTLRGNGVPMVGIGIVKQSKANTLEVARAAKEEMVRTNSMLPKHIQLFQSYDTSIFIESSISEVYITLGIAVALVILMIYLFLGSVRSMLVPAVTVPVSLIGTFIVLFAFGYTINLLTLLALVLAIGLVVDDAIVVLENIYRRIEMGEPPMVAAFRGSRQVGFAVIATTAVLVSVFMPITFLSGNVGRLFSEFAVALSAAVIFSSVVALTLSPMLSSKLLRHETRGGFTKWLDEHFDALSHAYQRVLARIIQVPGFTLVFMAGLVVACVVLFRVIPMEFTPQEDRGVFLVFIKGPEGASYDYVMEHVDMVEQRLMPFVESGEIERLLFRAPGSFGTTANFNDAIGIIVLSHWNTGRKPVDYYIGEALQRTADIPGVFMFPVQPSAFGGRQQKPMQFVLGGPSYEELAKWRDVLLKELNENNPGLEGIDHDYKETKPQLGIRILYDRAATLGVSVQQINGALESLLGTKRVTTYLDAGEEYDVILESEKSQKSKPSDIDNVYVRSETTGKLIPLSNVAEVHEFADARELNRYNKQRAITIEASLQPGYQLGDALDYMEELVREKLPEGASIDYKGESLELKDSSSQILLVFALALIVVYLVLAAQFESFVHPLVIMFTVPLAISGALFVMWMTGDTLNIYSEIGLIILVGIATKNGILIVEFVNQLRDEGMEFYAAIIDASEKRFRPIIMTSLTTAIGAVPLILASGAGAESRSVIGLVIGAGVLAATFFTLFVVPTMYALLAKNTKSPEENAHKLESLLKQHERKI